MNVDRSNARRLIGAVATVALTMFVAYGCGSSDDEPSGCGSDADCKGDRVCEEGECVDPSDSGGSDDSGGGSGGGSSQACCSLNGKYYACPSASAAKSCFQDRKPGECTRESSKDGECGPSGGSGSGGNSSGGGSSGGGSSGGSMGKDLGSSCNLDSDCKSDFCYEPGVNTEGYCSKGCTSFTDCPSDVSWDCEDVDDHPNKICVKS